MVFHPTFSDKVKRDESVRRRRRRRRRRRSGAICRVGSTLRHHLSSWPDTDDNFLRIKLCQPVIKIYEGKDVKSLRLIFASLINNFLRYVWGRPFALKKLRLEK